MKNEKIRKNNYEKYNLIDLDCIRNIKIISSIRDDIKIYFWNKLILNESIIVFL